MFRSAGPSSVGSPPRAEINASRCSYTLEESTPASRASGLRGPGVLGAPSEYRKAMRLPSEDQRGVSSGPWALVMIFTSRLLAVADRESTRLNSRHPVISYSVFFLKKKKKFHMYL